MADPLKSDTTTTSSGGTVGSVHSEAPSALITNDAVVLGLLLVILAVIFWTSSSRHPALQRFYRVVPMLLLCYFVPSLLTTFGVVDGEHSNLYFVASRYLLPASLVLLTLSVDLREIARLGYKPVVMFLAGTTGVIIGGPLAILITALVNPELVGGTGPEAVWKGMATIAGSWIGGGANQAAMFEIFSPSNALYSVMITIDVIVAEIWMAFLLLGIGQRHLINRWLKADASSVDQLRDKMEAFSISIRRVPTTTDLMVIAGVAFGATAVSHASADALAPFIKAHAPYLERFSLTKEFFWLVVIATTLGVGLSFSPLKRLEGAGASKVGSVFIFILVATIGMKMNILAIFRYPGLFVVGAIWMSIHIATLFFAAFLIRAPYFFVAVGSKANIGGAASAPVLAAAFHPSLAPVGVLLAVLGYVLGTYGAWVCALLMQASAP